MKDFYRILGVPENAHEQDIKLAFRRLAKRYHPDVNPGSVEAEERFKEINEAYNTLSDPLLKNAYDRKRLRQDVFSSNFSFNSGGDKKEKKDPRKKEYSQEDLERARDLHKKRTLAHMARRKKMLAGMIVTFILFLTGAAAFENWMAEQNKKDSEARRRSFDSARKKEVTFDPITKRIINTADSPYDAIFGEGVYREYSPNYIVIYNPISDAVVCAIQANAPHKTIRNEFIAADSTLTPLVLRELPDGIYSIKVYTGSDWDVNKLTPDGQKLGGFKIDEQFFRIKAGPFKLTKPTFDHPNTSFADTIVIDPHVMRMVKITREEFYSPGDK